MCLPSFPPSIQCSEESFATDDSAPEEIESPIFSQLGTYSRTDGMKHDQLFPNQPNDQEGDYTWKQ